MNVNSQDDDNLNPEAFELLVNSTKTWRITSKGAIEILTYSGQKTLLSKRTDVNAWLERWGIPVKRD